MDFFEQQAKANKTSRLLIIGYIIALIIIVIGFNFAGLVVWASASEPLSGLTDTEHSFIILIQLWLDSRYCWQVTVSVILFIGIVSIVNWLSLRQGGSKVAKMMGGRPVPAQTLDSNEKTLINVVEEMAIASGVPTPALFVMDNEHGMNAFAAGYTSNEAAICVTRGLLLQLTRDELQGVIAHEFSHILNGDMRINIRIISIMYGLVAIGQLGRWLIEISFYRSHDSRNSPIFLAIPGILIWLIGSLGIVCSRIIKAAISRQREFLADASAVQYTRQTDGISSALYKISQHQIGSKLVSSHAEDLSHMCIARTLNVKFSSLLDTHPPIEERIRRVSPSFLTRAKIQKAQQRTQSSHEAAQPETTYAQPSTSHDPYNPITQSFSSTDQGDNASFYNQPLQADEMIEFRTQHHDAQIQQALNHIGTTDQTNLDAARDYLSNISEEVLTALHQPDYASLIVLLLLVEANSDSENALHELKQHAPAHTDSTTLTLLEHYQNVVSSLKGQPIFPLLQIGLNSLKQLENKQQIGLLHTAKKILISDKKVDPNELLIYLVLFRHLKPKASRRQPIVFQTFANIEQELTTLMTFFVQFTDEEYRQEVLTRELLFFNISTQPGQISIKVNHDQLANAIFRLEHLAPILKKNVLSSLVDLIKHDNKITTEELDWLRMLADCWDTPIPFALGYTPDH